MPLLDHFHEPIDPRARWESFHHRWANAIADGLDGTLPPQFYAGVEVHLGPDVAADVAEFEPETDVSLNGAQSGGVAIQTYSPPTATMTLPGKFLEETEIQVRARSGERLLGVVELLSLANKENPTNREAFAAKLSAYLMAGIGVVVVDVVTSSHFNLHDVFVKLFGLGSEYQMPGAPDICACAYRPVSRDLEAQIDTWLTPLHVGHELPTVPFYLRGFGCIPLDLEASYTETRRRNRLR